TMSSRGTSSPLPEETSCCFTREPSRRSIWLKRMVAADSAAEYSLTGMDTSPKEIVAEPSGRAAIARSYSRTAAPARRTYLELETYDRNRGPVSNPRGVRSGRRWVVGVGIPRRSPPCGRPDGDGRPHGGLLRGAAKCCQLCEAVGAEPGTCTSFSPR